MLRISLSGLPCAHSTTESSNSPRVTKSMSSLAFKVSSGLMCPCGPTNAIFRLGFASLILRISLTSLSNPTVEVNKIRNSYSLQISTVCCQLTLCGDASSNRLPGIMPAGYVNHTGYQYDSISRVAGHRELAPPSKFSKLGGFNSNVFITSGIRHPQLLLAEIVPPLSPQTLPPLLCLSGAPKVQYLVYRSCARGSKSLSERCFPALN